MKLRQKIALILGIAGCVCSTPLHASSITYHVFLDTSALRGSTNVHALDFQLVDGDGGNNSSAVVNNLSFGTGGPRSTPDLTGGAAGSLSSAVTLSDVAFFNDFFQRFVPGGHLAFDLTLASAATGLTPDSFAFGIDGGPGGSFDVFLQVDLLEGLQSIHLTSPIGGVTASVNVPDSGSALMLPMALAAMMGLRAFGRRDGRRRMGTSNP